MCHVVVIVAGITGVTTAYVLSQLGYQYRESIPDALIDAALQMIKVFFYEGEKQSNTTLIPENVHQILGAYRRFTV